MALATERDSLLQQVEILRQMAVLALGPAHHCYLSLNNAYRSRSVKKMQDAIDEFNRLPQASKNYALGLDQEADELTGTD